MRKNWSSSLAQDCGTGNTAGNTASQLQLEFPPSEVAQDQLLISALLTSNADVSVYFNDGETVINPSWDFLPSSGVPGEGGPGIYHTSVPLRHFIWICMSRVAGEGTVVPTVLDVGSGKTKKLCI